jgi:hypothetical protein
MAIAGVALAPSWKRGALGTVALVVGCAPIWFLLAWFALG